MRTEEIKIYQFSELSEEAKQNAIQEMSDINFMFDWWDTIYEDAKNVHIKITGFDIDRGSYCHGDFLTNAKDVAERIIKEHGDQCETHKTAQKFLDELQTLIYDAKQAWEEYQEDTKDDDVVNYADFEDFFYYKYQEDADQLEEDFQNDILEDYRIMLQKEYDYLSSDEAIIESIEANEYEFTENGKRY